MISLNEVVLLSVTLYFLAILFSLRRFLKLLPVIISECCVQLHNTNITYTLSSTRGYSGVIYKNNKYTIIKLQWGKNIYICYNKKYLHEFIYNHEKCDSIYLRRVSKKVGGDFLLKLEILFKFRMFSGSRLYSFAPRKAKEL